MLYASMNWRNISYLASGTSRQREVHALLTNYQILDILAEFDPVLVSTICLNIDIPTSDLDIICHVADTAKFEKCLRAHFGDNRNFIFRCRDDSQRSIVCSFLIDQMELEIFGNPVPVQQQPAYRHLSVTHRLLTLSGEWLRMCVKTQKLSGLKTEPAIAIILGLDGDPYAAVLALEDKSDSDLHDLLKKAYNNELFRMASPPEN